jgi:uncharacterized damage-inducible protein DinB
MTNQSQSQTSYETTDTLFRHNLWANSRLFELCAGLSDEQLDARIVGTYGSIREMLVHIATAERSYLQRIRTGVPYRRPKDAPLPNVAELQESIHASGEGLVVTAPTVRPEDSVQIDREGTSFLLPCAVLLVQAINHATEHRSQIMATLTQIGIQPPDLDGWTYFSAGRS